MQQGPKASPKRQCPLKEKKKNKQAHRTRSNKSSKRKSEKKPKQKNTWNKVQKRPLKGKKW